MVLALQSMREAAGDPARDQVIMPAYTCYSVAASVIKAGLKPRLCDIDPLTLSMDLDALARFDFSRVVAIVTANLYGIPNRLDAIEALARRMGVWMLDDAAQALGAVHAGRPVGGFGHAGLYSFDKGKNITSLDGGAIVTSEAELIAAMDRRCESLRNTPPLRTALNLAKLGAYSVLLRPGCYGVVRKLPGLGLGRTVYDESYPLQRYSRVLAGFAQTLFERLHSLSERRRANAAALLEVLREINGVRVIEPSPDSQPAFVRLPFLVDDPARRSTVIERLDRAGIGATASYPSALCDVPEIAGVLPASDRTMPGAQRVARSIVTLPTHPYCPPELPRRVADVLRRSLR